MRNQIHDSMFPQFLVDSKKKKKKKKKQISESFFSPPNSIYSRYAFAVPFSPSQT